MDLSKADVLKIIKIIDESDYDDVRIELGDFKLYVQKSAANAVRIHEAPAIGPKTNASITSLQTPSRSAASTAAAAAAPEQVASESLPEGAVAVLAPMLGTFYRAPAPGERPFVEVGDAVGPDDTVCLVEVMKLFNSVKAGVPGRVLKILPENGAMVEHGQTLMLIEKR